MPFNPRTDVLPVGQAHPHYAKQPHSMASCQILGYKIFVVIWRAVVTLRVTYDNELGVLRIEYNELPQPEVVQ